MSLLELPVVVPIWIVAVPIIAVMVLIAFLIWYIRDNSFYCPELSMFKTARKRNLPILKKHMHNGYFKRYLGEKEKKGSIIFKFDQNSKEGLRIDPGVQGGNIPHGFSTGGLVEYDYSTSAPFEMSAKTAVAQDRILKHVREKYPILNGFDGQTILEYVSRERGYLAEDCLNLATMTDIDVRPSPVDLDILKQQVSDKLREECETKRIELSDDQFNALVDKEFIQKRSSFITEFRANYLTRLFMQIQDEVSELPLPPGQFFSFAEAFVHTASALTSFDLQTVMQLFEQIAERTKYDDLKWMILVLIGAGAFIALLAFAWTLIQAGKG